MAATAGLLTVGDLRARGKEEIKSQVTSVSLAIPTLIRILELAREGIPDDAQLHIFVEHLMTQMYMRGTPLDMEAYSEAYENYLSECQELNLPALTETSRVRKPDDVDAKVTLSGSKECVRRVQRLLACIEYNGGVGHSGTFGITWDGDGADRIRIDGLPKDIDRKQFEAQSNYGGAVEVVGEGETCFVLDNSTDPNYPYLKSRRVWPAEETAFVEEAKTRRPFTGTAGVYVSRELTPLSKAKITAFLRSQFPSLPIDDSDIEEQHCTVVYSKTCVRDLDTALPSAAPANIQVASLEYWEGHDKDGYLVAKLVAPELIERHKFWLSEGAVHSFSPYEPHVTLKTPLKQTPRLQQELAEANRFLRTFQLDVTLAGEVLEDLKASAFE
jgi:hypothetical protein